MGFKNFTILIETSITVGILKILNFYWFFLKKLMGLKNQFFKIDGFNGSHWTHDNEATVPTYLCYVENQKISRLELSHHQKLICSQLLFCLYKKTKSCVSTKSWPTIVVQKYICHYSIFFSILSHFMFIILFKHLKNSFFWN